MSSASSTSSSQLHRWLTAYCSLSLSWLSAWIEDFIQANKPLPCLSYATQVNSPGFYSKLQSKEPKFPGEGDYRPYWLAEIPVLGIRPSTSHNRVEFVSLPQLSWVSQPMPYNGTLDKRHLGLMLRSACIAKVKVSWKIGCNSFLLLLLPT